MIKINTNKILIPVDFSKTANRAIHHGAFMAQLTKGQIILLNVQKRSELLDIILPAINMKDTSVITDFLEQKLEMMAQEIKKEYGIRVSTFVSTGNITSEIVNLANEKRVDLIVMGTEGKDSTNDLFMGSNSYRTITKSPIPVMTVREDVSKKGYGKILLPIDTSPHTRQKVRAAISLADKFASKIHVLCMLKPNEEESKYKMEVIISQIEKLAQKKGVPVSSEIQKTTNPASTTLVISKKIKANLIISMTDQNTGFSGLLLGNYVHQLLNEAKVPVIAVPPVINEDQMSNSMGGLF